MARLRARPPAALAGRRVEETRDLLADPGPLPVADVLVLRLDGARVVVRPSGTEPKLKAYLEVVAPVSGDLAATRDRAAAALRDLRGAVAEALGL